MPTKWCKDSSDSNSVSWISADSDLSFLSVAEVDNMAIYEKEGGTISERILSPDPLPLIAILALSLTDRVQRRGYHLT